MAVELEDITVGAGEHVVQFYERQSELADTVGRYLLTAIREAAVAIVIATPAHRRSFEAELERAGADPSALSHCGRLMFLDAAETLARFMDEGKINPDAFERTIGSVIREVARPGRPVWVYGEMVALLWEAGNVMGAIELEKAWNELAGEVPFALVCGYRSESVRGHEHADALAQVCHLHTSVLHRPAPQESDASSPSPEISRHFPGERTAPGDARHFATDAVKRWNQPDNLVADIQLVVTELAANAVIHAGSSFSVQLRQHPGGVRVAVADQSPIPPIARDDGPLADSGRGLRLVGMIAGSWGVELTDSGKTVWAELENRAASQFEAPSAASCITPPGRAQERLGHP